MSRKNILVSEVYNKKLQLYKERIYALQAEGTFTGKSVNVVINAGDAKGCAAGQVLLDALDACNVTYTHSFNIWQHLPKPVNTDENKELLESMFGITINVETFTLFDLLEELQDGGFGSLEGEHIKHLRFRKFVIARTSQDNITLCITGHTGKGMRTWGLSQEAREGAAEMLATPLKQTLKKAPWCDNLWITAGEIDTATTFTEEAKNTLSTVDKPDLFYNIHPSLISADFPLDSPTM